MRPGLPWYVPPYRHAGLRDPNAVRGLGYLGALVLGAVFVWAAAAKLAGRAQAVTGFAALGLPAPQAMARLVPAAELATAVLLVAVPRPGGLVALALLAAFSVVIARAVLRGVEAGCSCFGVASRRPISPTDLGRNALLASLALAAAATPRPTPPPWWSVVAVVAGAVLWFTAGRRTSGPSGP